MPLPQLRTEMDFSPGFNALSRADAYKNQLQQQQFENTLAKRKMNLLEQSAQPKRGDNLSYVDQMQKAKLNNLKVLKTAASLAPTKEQVPQAIRFIEDYNTKLEEQGLSDFAIPIPQILENVNNLSDEEYQKGWNEFITADPEFFIKKAEEEMKRQSPEELQAEEYAKAFGKARGEEAGKPANDDKPYKVGYIDEIKKGNKIITREWNGNGWDTIAEAPRSSSPSEPTRKDLQKEITDTNRRIANLQRGVGVASHVTQPQIDQSIERLKKEKDILSRALRGDIGMRQFAEEMAAIDQELPDIDNTIETEENVGLDVTFNGLDPGIYEYEGKQYRWDGKNATEVK